MGCSGSSQMVAPIRTRPKQEVPNQENEQLQLNLDALPVDMDPEEQITPIFNLPSVSVSPTILSSRTLLQAPFLSPDSSIQDSPSFFNPLNKPSIFEYQFEQHIGHGSASDVFLVYNTENNIYYAAKVYSHTYLYRTSIGDAEKPIEKVAREIQIMSDCQHPNLLPLVEVIDDEPTHYLILILPYAQNGALSKSSWKATPLSEADAKNVFRQLADGLQYLHSLNIIHRDIKPENVLCFKDGHVCISDFSVSAKLDDPDVFLDDTQGTPVFYSPEQCTGEPYQGKPADCWAFGIMLYVMIYGKLPFFEADDEKIFGAHFFKISEVISSEELKYPEEPKISDQLADLFSHILDRDPLSRYTMDQIVEHPWFNFD